MSRPRKPTPLHLEGYSFKSAEAITREEAKALELPHMVAGIDAPVLTLPQARKLHAWLGRVIAWAEATQEARNP